MHISDGFLDPKVSYGLMGVAVAVLACSLQKVTATVTEWAPQEVFAAVGQGIKSISGRSRRVFSALGGGKIYLMGMVGALIFTVQMCDFSVIAGSTGHLMGGIFAAVLLGPFAGTLVMSAVLIIQALFLADGGIVALGANIVNLALIGTLASYYIYAGLKKVLPEQLGIFIAAWCSLVMVAAAVSLELGSTGTLLKVHAIVGAAEGLVTIVMVNLFRSLYVAKP